MKLKVENVSYAKTINILKCSIFCGGHPYVEIGGIKWATMNVGADCETDYGLYFQWGDTQGYTAPQVGTEEYFNFRDYKYSDDLTFTKYTEDGLHTLESTDDAVTAAWGRKWRMPTTSEFIALGSATTSAWTYNYQGSGVNGMVLTDKTDSSKVLFFPACGYAGYGSVYDVGIGGKYWSNSLNALSLSGAYSMIFYRGYVDWQYYEGRCLGHSVRGILDA